MQLNNGTYVGTMIPQNYLGSVPSNFATGASFGLDLDYYIISQIERFREGKDLQLQLVIKLFVQAKAPQAFSTPLQMNIPARIPKSDWVETYLPQLRFRDAMLVELPKIEGADYKEAIDHLNSAWKQRGFGEYDKVLEECRKALEAMKEALKKKGVVKESEVDWKQILQSGTAGEYVSEIHRSAVGFDSRGAHIGKSINREDADFALLTTYALLELLSKRTA